MKKLLIGCAGLIMLGVVLLVVVAAVGGGRQPSQTAASKPAAPTSTVAPTPAAKVEPIRLGGDRGVVTPPFSLPAGTYVAAYKTELRPGQTSCFTAATLYRVDGKRRVQAIYSTTLNQRQGQTSATGETHLYGVVAGPHFVEAEETGCSWSVEIRPQ